MRPTIQCGRLPSFISQHGREPDLPRHVEAPRPSAPGQSRTGRLGPCAPRLPPRTTGVPIKLGPRTGSTTSAPLIARGKLRLQGSLRKGQRLPYGARDTTGEGVNGHRLPCRNDGRPYAPLHYSSERDRTALPSLGKAPLTGRAVLQPGTTRGGREEALQISSVGTGG